MLSASLHSHRNSRHRAHKCQCKLGKLMCSRLNSSAPRIPRYPPLSGHCLATCQMHSFLNQLLPTTPPPTTSPHHLSERTKMQKYATYNREIIEQNALTPGLHPPNPTPSAEAQPNRGKKRRKRLTSVSHSLTSALRSVVCPSNPQTQKEICRRCFSITMNPSFPFPIRKFTSEFGHSPFDRSGVKSWVR